MRLGFQLGLELAVDLRLGTRFILFRHARTPYIDPLAQDAADYTEVMEIAEDDRFIATLRNALHK